MEQIITDEIQKKDEETVFRGLLSYNLEKLDDKNPRDVGIYYKDNGTIVAGLIGQTHGNWLTVKYLWVTESLRGQHIGTNLLEHAERIAKNEAAIIVFWIPLVFRHLNSTKNKDIGKYLLKKNILFQGKDIILRKHYFMKIKN